MPADHSRGFDNENARLPILLVVRHFPQKCRLVRPPRAMGEGGGREAQLAKPPHPARPARGKNQKGRESPRAAARRCLMRCLISAD
jgi:hypothetical protein